MAYPQLVRAFQVMVPNDEFCGDATLERFVDQHQAIDDAAGAVMMTVTELLSRAKLAIESGDSSMRAAAEDIVTAQELGATQRQIAEAVGKSAAWVNRLLKWRPGNQ
jgi:hypothetical protein